MSVDPINLFETKPNISSKYLRVEENLSLHYRHDLPGHLEVPDGFSHHLMTFFLTDNKRQITHLDSCGEYDGQMSQGEFYLYPAQVSGFTNWQEIDKTLHLMIKPHFLREIAVKTESINPNRIELLPILKKHDNRIEQLVHLFLNEIQNQDVGSQLYLESLANILGVHLLRNYSTFKPIFRRYTDGLADYQLHQTIDYIKSNLDQKLTLQDLAKNIDMGRYYFATQFKQAMGISPYKYITLQRLAKAKRLLRERKRSLVDSVLKHTPSDMAHGTKALAACDPQQRVESLFDIALDCGFASQSHFNKVFRQYVGTTPKKYLDDL